MEKILENNSVSTNVETSENKAVKTYILALGGLNEIGKNTYCIEHGGNIIVIPKD